MEGGERKTYDLEAAALVGRILRTIEGSDEMKGALVDEVYRHP